MIYSLKLKQPLALSGLFKWKFVISKLDKNLSIEQVFSCRSSPYETNEKCFVYIKISTISRVKSTDRKGFKCRTK